MRLWVFIFLYIFLIYSTLPFGSYLFGMLEKALGSGGAGALVNVFVGCFFLFGAFYLYKKAGFSSLPYLLAGFLILAFISLGIERPAERVHFVEYGILGFLVAKAFELRSFLASVTFVFFVGVVDEVIQWVLPNRTGDLRDVLMNTVGGVIGVWLRRSVG